MSFSWRDLAGPNPCPMSKPECLGLQKLVKQLPNKPIIVQIGAERGTSTLAMLEARPDAYIYSIDMGICEQEFRNLRRAGLPASRVERVQGKSHEVGKVWDKLCDMLFIDGDHSAAGVAGDIEYFEPWLKSGGIIVFHDYIPEPIPPEIKGRVVYAVDPWQEKAQYEEILWIERLRAFQKP